MGRTSLTRRARAGIAPGAVLLGDAAFSRDPLTAGGIAHALVTAERLAAIVPYALTEGDPWLARFERDRRRLLRAHGWLTRALVGLVARPWLARTTMRAMRAAPSVMPTLLGVGGGIDLQPAPRADRHHDPDQLGPRAADQQRHRPEGDALPAGPVAIAAPHDADRLPARERRQQQRRDDGGSVAHAPSDRAPLKRGSAPNPAT